MTMWFYGCVYSISVYVSASFCRCWTMSSASLLLPIGQSILEMCDYFIKFFSSAVAALMHSLFIY